MAELDAYAEFEDFEAHAEEVLARPIFDHLNAGAGRNWTRDENRRAFDRWLIRKKLMRDVSAVDTSVTVAGQHLDVPILLAPSAFHKLVHPDGELASAGAAKAMGTGMVLSTLSSVPLEEVAAVGLPCWLQLQIHKDRGITTSLQERAEAAGFRGLCLTVDAPNYGIRPADKRSHMHLPRDVRIANLDDRIDLPSKATGETIMAYLWREMAQDLTWDDAAWFVERTSLPVIAKGVMTAVEARNAVNAGCTHRGGVESGRPADRRRASHHGRADRGRRRGRRRGGRAARRWRPAGRARAQGARPRRPLRTDRPADLLGSRGGRRRRRHGRCWSC